jgi:hypothetical protein
MLVPAGGGAVGSPPSPALLFSQPAAKSITAATITVAPSGNFQFLLTSESLLKSKHNGQ